MRDFLSLKDRCRKCTWWAANAGEWNLENFWQPSMMQCKDDKTQGEYSALEIHWKARHFSLLSEATRRTRVSFGKPTFELSKLRANGNRRRSPGRQAGSKARTRRRTTGACAKRRRSQENAPFELCWSRRGRAGARFGAGEGERAWCYNKIVRRNFVRNDPKLTNFFHKRPRKIHMFNNAADCGGHRKRFRAVPVGDAFDRPCTGLGTKFVGGMRAPFRRAHQGYSLDIH